MLGRELGDGGGLGRLGAADADAGETEAAGEQDEALAARGESEVGEGEAAGSGCEDW